MGCMQSAEEIKNEREKAKAKTQNAKHRVASAHRQRDARSKKEIQSSIYLGPQSTSMGKAIKIHQEKLKESLSKKFLEPRIN